MRVGGRGEEAYCCYLRDKAGTRATRCSVTAPRKYICQSGPMGFDILDFTGIGSDHRPFPLSSRVKLSATRCFTSIRTSSPVFTICGLPFLLIITRGAIKVNYIFVFRKYLFFHIQKYNIWKHIRTNHVDKGWWHMFVTRLPILGISPGPAPLPYMRWWDHFTESGPVPLEIRISNSFRNWAHTILFSVRFRGLLRQDDMPYGIPCGQEVTNATISSEIIIKIWMGSHGFYFSRSVHFLEVSPEWILRASSITNPQGVEDL